MITEWAHIFLSTIIHKEFCSNNADKLCSVYTLALFLKRVRDDWRQASDTLMCINTTLRAPVTHWVWRHKLARVNIAVETR